MSDSVVSTGVKQRIFVVGVPRSGTTLLQALVAAHPQVESFTESHLFSRPYGHLPGLGLVLAADPTPRLMEFLLENVVSPAEVAPWFGPPKPAELNGRVGLARNTRKVTRQLVAVLDTMCLQRGSSIWLEKTPRHLRAIDLLTSVCDDGVPIHFVHGFRDGLQTVASLLTASRSWPEPYGLDACVERWNRDLKRSVAYLGKPGHSFVRYERLTEDPESVLRALFPALGLPWDTGVLTAFGQVASRLKTPEESWKRGADRRIKASATAGQVLDAAERARVQAALQSELYQRLRREALGEADG